MRHFITKMSLLLLLLSLFGWTYAAAMQAPDQPQTGSGIAAINPVTFTSPGKVNALIPLSDGSVLAGGQFVAIGGQSTPCSLAKIMSNGMLDPGFQADASLRVTELFAAALQPDGKIVIAGIFQVLPDSFSYYLLRLNTNGSLDGNFQASPLAFNNLVTSIMMDGDKIVVGGNFTSPTANIARLNANGTVDPAFSNLGSGPGGEVHALARQSSGNYIVVGSFGVARLNNDGERDVAFVPDGFRSSTQVAVLNDDSVLVGSENICGEDVFRWYAADGTNRSVSGSDPNDFDSITAFLPLPDGGFLIGGWHSSVCYESSPLYHEGQIWRYAADGSYRTMTSFGDEADIFALALRSDGKVLAGGQGRPATAVEVGLFDGLALLDLSNDGLEKEAAFHPVVGDEAEIYDLSAYSDGRLLVAGNFSHANGLPRNGLARILSNGTLEPDFAPFANLPPNGWSRATLALPDGRAVAGFANSGLYLVNLDGSLTDLSTFNNYDRVSALAYQSDGKVLVGSNWGWGVRRMMADFSGADPAFTGGDAYGSVYDLAVANAQIYVAGDFSKYDDESFPGLVRLNNDGSIDGSFAPPVFQDDVGNSGTLYQVVPLAGGGVLVGGSFYQADGAAHPSLVRLSSEGTLDLDFTSPDSFRMVKSLCVQADNGSIWAGGKAENSFLSPQVRHFNTDGTLDINGTNSYLTAHSNDGAVNAVLCGSGLSWAGGRFSLIDNLPFFGLARFFTVNAQLFLPVVQK